MARAWFGQKTQLEDGSAGIAFLATWARPGHEVKLDDPRIRGGVPLRDLGLQPHLDAFEAGQPLAALVRDMAPSEQGFSTRMGSRSFVGVPILCQQRWWGVLAFGETRYERVWSASEVEALKAARGGGGGGDRARERGRARCARARSASSALSAATFEGIAVTEEGVFVDANDQLAQMFGRRSPT